VRSVLNHSYLVPIGPYIRYQLSVGQSNIAFVLFENE